MGSDIKKAYGATGRDELPLFNPEDLIVVTDKTHPLYDERVNLPLDEALVLNIMVNGVIAPITIRKNGEDADGKPIVEVIDGRQRVRAAVEANKRLAAAGKQTIAVPAVRRRGEAVDMAGIMISANELRRNDGPIVRARKVGRFMAMGRTLEEAAVQFGVSVQTIKDMLTLLELHPDVKKKIEHDNLPAYVAKELGKLPQEKQSEALAKLVESGNIRGARGVQAAKAVAKGKAADSDKGRLLSRKKLEAWGVHLEKIEDIEGTVAYAVVSWILGTTTALKGFKLLESSFEEAMKPKVKEPKPPKAPKPRKEKKVKEPKPPKVRKEKKVKEPKAPRLPKAKKLKEEK